MSALGNPDSSSLHCPAFQSGPRQIIALSDCHKVTYTLPLNIKIKLEEYIREDGGNPYQAWFNTLDTQAAVKVTVAKARLELGNTSNIEWFRGIGECKIDWGPGYRIYLAKDGEALIILFGGSTKKGQQKAFDQAIALHEEYKLRKKTLTRRAKKK